MTYPAGVGKREDAVRDLSFVNIYCQYPLRSGFHVHNPGVNFTLSCT